MKHEMYKCINPKYSKHILQFQIRADGILHCVQVVPSSVPHTQMLFAKLAAPH